MDTEKIREIEARGRLRRLSRAGEVGIDIYQGKGVMLRGGSSRVGLPDGAGGARGEITGWSSASRRRMREFLLTHTFPEGWSCFGATLTIPGRWEPKIGGYGSPSVDQVNELRRQYFQAIARAGGAAVWRLELQKRGMPHYHALVILPPGAEVGPLIRGNWFQMMDRLLPPIEHEIVPNPGPMGGYVVRVFGASWWSREPVFSRSRMRGAARHSVNIQSEGGRGSWLRYLQDHATKAKQDQVAEGWGRHWAVVGRSRFVTAIPVTVPELSPPEYFRVVRWLNRLATPYRKDPGALFGRSRGYKPTRGRVGFGQAVVFTNPETVARMIDCARLLTATGPGGNISMVEPGLPTQRGENAKHRKTTTDKADR